MDSKSIGWNLGGRPLHELGKRWSLFSLVLYCLFPLSGVARAQICPGGACTVPNQTVECNDNLFCTTDLCIAGTCACVANTCNDNLFCTQDACNETSDACEHPPTDCQAPTPQCSETLDSCVECLNAGHCTTPPELRCNSSGTCVQCTSSVQCQDSSWCNGFESCNLSTGFCEAGTPVTCPKGCFMGTQPPGTTCTADQDCGTGGQCLGYCNDTRAECVQCKVDADCDDGKFCNGAETCDGNDECVVGTPPVCKKCVGGSEEGQPCSEAADCPGSPAGTCTGGPSYCYEPFGRCVACLNASHCEDLNYCTSNACSPLDQTCSFSPNPSICGDGAFCNGDEVCNHVLGNDCSLFRDQAHCCFKGICSTSSPPKGCNSNADCPVGTGICNNSTAPSCNADHSVCTRDCTDSVTCTVDICNETIDQCQYTPNNALCPGSSLACNGTETCDPGAPGADPADGCVAGTPMDCTSFSTDCSIGACLENPPPAHCQGQATNQGLSCNDVNPCTALSKCNNGSCVDNPPTVNDPWRCVRLEWRSSSPTTVLAGATVDLSLYAVATGCNTAHVSNERCIGGAVNGISCTTSANCRVCVGGNNAGLECVSDAFCSGGGGTCPVGGTCTDLCPSTSLPISSIDALFTWNKTFLQLNPSTGPDPNPVDACVSPTTCTACPLNTYGFPLTGGFSGWISDCTGDGLNEPCTGGVPANDGNARYLGFQGINQNCEWACATTAGLKVTTVKFKAISGGTSSIALLPCYGAGSKTKVDSPLVWDGVPTSDVTKSLGPAIAITVTCDSHDDCDDNNNCTTDTCNCTTPNCGGNCLHANNTNTCDDGLFCTGPDGCVSGVCQGPQVCKKCVGGPNVGEPCSVTAECGAPGTCTGGASFCQETNDRCVECQTAANCNDGLGNTVDGCVKTCSGGTNFGGICSVIGDCPGAGGACESDYCEHIPINCDDGVACTDDVSDPGDGHCTNTTNHSFCNPLGFSFCESVICDPVVGCIFDHECISEDGNPCPNPGTCNESSNTCGGCKQPTVVSAGPRFLSVTPLDQDSTPVAFLVNGDCSDPVSACVHRYLQSKCLGGSNNGQNCNTDADCPKRCVGGQFPNAACTSLAECPQGECIGRCDAGTLGSTPYYKPSSLWGTPKVRGTQIRPGTTYLVHAECDFGGTTVLSSAASAKTWKWGDVDNDEIVNAIDVVNMVNAFKGFFGPFTFEQMNLYGCQPDEVLNALDIAVCVDAVRGYAYPCSIVCP